jgi:glutathione peroxidase-family protein
MENNLPNHLWDTQIKDIDGNQTSLKQYTPGKKAFVFVNVACK